MLEGMKENGKEIEYLRSEIKRLTAKKYRGRYDRFMLQVHKDNLKSYYPKG